MKYREVESGGNGRLYTPDDQVVLLEIDLEPEDFASEIDGVEGECEVKLDEHELKKHAVEFLDDIGLPEDEVEIFATQKEAWRLVNLLNQYTDGKLKATIRELQESA